MSRTMFARTLKALEDILDARSAESAAWIALDNAEKNLSDPWPERREHERAMRALNNAVLNASSVLHEAKALSGSWQLVPTEPTQAMLAVDAPPAEWDGALATTTYRRGLWKVMLETAN